MGGMVTVVGAGVVEVVEAVVVVDEVVVAALAARAVYSRFTHQEHLSAYLRAGE